MEEVVVVVDLRRGRLPLDEDLTWRHSHPSSATAAADRTTWRGTSPRGPVAAHTLIYRCTPRDCLAPPYAVSEDMNGAKPVVKNCYRCKKDGHVNELLLLTLSR